MFSFKFSLIFSIVVWRHYEMFQVVQNDIPPESMDAMRPVQ
jgi:hypothetical protein